MSKFAIVTASGVGDGLVMLIAAHHLRQLGHDVVVFNPHLASFGKWLEKGEYTPLLPSFQKTLRSFDALLLQHDNTPVAREITQLRKSCLPIYIFYPTYRSSKHDPMVSGFDFAFDTDQTMVDNIIRGTQALFGSKVSRHNGLIPPPHLLYRKFPRKVMIHPVSGQEEKNWPKPKFLRLASLLKNEGFEPVFALSRKEKIGWQDIASPGFSTLESLASTMYECGFFIGNDSGPGHLASYLSIPHLIIASQKQNMRLWRPGWYRGELVLPPDWIPNFKPLKIREQYWKKLITIKSVFQQFKSLLK